MSLTRKATHWFVTEVPRQQIVYALEALAATGQVELEQDIVGTLVPDNRALRDLIKAGESVIARHAELLPPYDGGNPMVIDRPEETARHALADVRGWLARQLRLRRRIAAGKRHLHNLELLREATEAMGDGSGELANLGHPSSFLSKRVYACPPGVPDGVIEGNAGIVESHDGDKHRFHVVVCLPEKGDAFDYLFRMQHCETVEVPEWLARDWPQRHARLPERIQALVQQLARSEAALSDNLREPALLAALRDLAVLRWYLEHTITLTEDRQRCHVAGWTSAASPAVLDEALHRVNIDAVTQFRPCPPNRRPPVASPHGWLTRPFRIFVDMLGTPGATEIDPTPLLSIIVPILFGLMFPDVGHGLVLAAVSLAMSPRHPRLRFLVPCGLAAAGFGALFGETFGSHAWLSPLWYYPLEQPLFTLLAPLVVGVLIILLGVVLSGIEAHLRGALRQWLWRDAAVLVLYLGALAIVFEPRALAVPGVALLWYLAGSVATCPRRRWRCLRDDIGRLLQSALELTLNTISFIRLGAFALAHTALTHALLETTVLIDSAVWQLIALIVGHGLIIVVEGLVVFVQTTRLILFEFFIRFLRADGRLLRPLQTPTRQAH